MIFIINCQSLSYLNVLLNPNTVSFKRKLVFDNHNYLSTYKSLSYLSVQKTQIICYQDTGLLKFFVFSFLMYIFPQVSGQVIEVKTPLTHRDYTHLLDQQDPLHLTVNKIRRCFLYNNQYFQVKKNIKCVFTMWRS